MHKIDYLESHSDNPEKVKLYWSETRELRNSYLKVERKSVEEYLLKFKALREQLGRELVCTFFIDIEIVYYISFRNSIYLKPFVPNNIHTKHIK